MKILLKYLLVIILCFFLGCEDENSDGIQIPSKVIISPLNLILKPNQSGGGFPSWSGAINKPIASCEAMHPSASFRPEHRTGSRQS